MNQTQCISPFSFPLQSDEYRSLPFPNNGHRTKLGIAFVRVDQLPPDLENWMKVNPRIPEKNKKDFLAKPVAKEIVATLLESPEKFALKNNGIFLLARNVDFKKNEGGQGIISIDLEDPDIHGLVNGGHTYMAIREALERYNTDESTDFSDPNTAYVRVHIMTGIEESEISEIAEGLNRAMQVDDPSLENLRGHFEKIKEHLKGKPGEHIISYKQGDDGILDVRTVLQFMLAFDLDTFYEENGQPVKHPNKHFGQPKSILDYFSSSHNPSDQNYSKSKNTFEKLLPRLHEILQISEKIQVEAAKTTTFSALKVKNTKKENRSGSKKHKGLPTYFLGTNETINGLILQGWLYPMLAAFRANVKPSAWNQGRMEWVVEPFELLKDVVPEMVKIVKQEHEDKNNSAADVGKKESAYRGCYGVVMLNLARRGMLEVTK